MDVCHKGLQAQASNNSHTPHLTASHKKGLTPEQGRRRNVPIRDRHREIVVRTQANRLQKEIAQSSPAIDVAKLDTLHLTLSVRNIKNPSSDRYTPPRSWTTGQMMTSWDTR